MVALPSHARAWLAQREAGAAALDEIHARELRELDAETALVQIDALLALGAAQRMPESRRVSSGLVAQQASFSRMRR